MRFGDEVQVKDLMALLLPAAPLRGRGLCGEDCLCQVQLLLGGLSAAEAKSSSGFTVQGLVSNSFSQRVSFSVDVISCILKLYSFVVGDKTVFVQV